MKITVNEWLADGRHWTVLDLRSPAERRYGTLPGAIPVRTGQLPELSLPADAPILLYDARGEGCGGAAVILEGRGFEACPLEGGYAAWVLEAIRRQRDTGLARRVEQSIRTTYRSRLYSRFTKALKEYRLVNAGDRVAVCISGGKDSMLLAKLFQELKRFSEVPFEVCYLVMDPGYSAANRFILEENARNLEIPVTIRDTEIFDSVYHIEKNPCYLCARMRRGYLYRFAKEMGCNKIALGHHFDDVIETVLMGMLYGGQIQTMMPKLHSDNFEGMELIRPLYLVREADIQAWRDHNGLHFLQCACKFTEANAASEGAAVLSKRYEVKELIQALKRDNPYVEKSIFRSMENVHADTVIAYKKDGVLHHFLDGYEDTAPPAR